MKTVKFQNFSSYIICSVYINNKYTIFRNSNPNYEKRRLPMVVIFFRLTTAFPTIIYTRKKRLSFLRTFNNSSSTIPPLEDNLVPTVLSYTRERPWKTLVTCRPGEKKTQEGSLFLKVLSPQSFVNIKMRHTSTTSLLRDLLHQ